MLEARTFTSTSIPQCLLESLIAKSSQATLTLNEPAVMKHLGDADAYAATMLRSLFGRSPGSISMESAPARERLSSSAGRVKTGLWGFVRHRVHRVPNPNVSVELRSSPRRP